MCSIYWIIIHVSKIFFRNLFSSTLYSEQKGNVGSTWGRTPSFGAQTPMVGSMTPSYGGMTPGGGGGGGGGRTPMYGSQTPMHDGEGVRVCVWGGDIVCIYMCVRF